MTQILGAEWRWSHCNNFLSQQFSLKRQKPYHDLLFTVHRMIIRFNGWQGCKVDVPFIQLTTLDEHRDVKEVTFQVTYE